MPYDRIKQLGEGHFGEVWLEEDAGLGRKCAAKYLNPLLLDISSPFAEAQAMHGAEHENVVRVYSADFEGDVPVIRMEYLPDGSVVDRYKGKPVPVATGIHIVEEACRGVEALHARGVLHRDIKPANLLIAEGERIKVSDFGLACKVSDLSGAPPWGYVEHLPPEAVRRRGIETVSGDVYALGVTLYRLLNGDDMLRASVAPGTDITPLIASGKYPNRSMWQPHIHDSLRRVTRKSLHCDPSRRYRSASELRHAIEGARPVVSWSQVSADDGHGAAWEGVDLKSGSKFRARLAVDKKGRYVFELERQTHGGQFRARRADRLTADSRTNAFRHAVQVLGRVASTGR